MNRVHILAISSGNRVYSGGLAGYLEGNPSSSAQQVDRNYSVLNVTNYANVVSITPWVSNAYSGGIIGYGTNFLTVMLCKNYGYVKGYSNDNDMVGGIVGYLNKSDISNCLNVGYIEGRLNTGLSSSYWSYIGGIVGIMVDGSIAHCVNIGSTYISYTQNDVSLGGIMGYAHSDSLPARDFSNDKVCIYSYDRTGFFEPDLDNNVLGSIGYYDQTSDSNYIETMANLLNNGIGYISSPTSADDSFDLDVWNDDGLLKTEGIFIIGCGAPAFSILLPEGVSIQGSNPGFYVTFEELLGSGVEFTYTASGKVSCGFVTIENGEYTYSSVSQEFESSVEDPVTLRLRDYLPSSISGGMVIVILSLEL